MNRILLFVLITFIFSLHARENYKVSTIISKSFNSVFEKHFKQALKEKVDLYNKKPFSVDAINNFKDSLNLSPRNISELQKQIKNKKFKKIPLKYENGTITITHKKMKIVIDHNLWSKKTITINDQTYQIRDLYNIEKEFWHINKFLNDSFIKRKNLNSNYSLNFIKLLFSDAFANPYDFNKNVERDALVNSPSFLITFTFSKFTDQFISHPTKIKGNDISDLIKGYIIDLKDKQNKCQKGQLLMGISNLKNNIIKSMKRDSPKTFKFKSCDDLFKIFENTKSYKFTNTKPEDNEEHILKVCTEISILEDCVQEKTVKDEYFRKEKKFIPKENIKIENGPKAIEI